MRQVELAKDKGQQKEEKVRNLDDESGLLDFIDDIFQTPDE